MTTRTGRPLRQTVLAQHDVRAILQRSEAEFGPAARRRYRGLIERALNALAASDRPPGSHTLPELGQAFCGYHLRFARAGQGARRVRRPRHVIVYRIDDHQILIIRVLHERQLPSRHVSDGESGDRQA